MDEQLKYNTLAKLKAAYESGELKQDNPLMLDNDSSAVFITDSNSVGGVTEVFEGGSAEELIEEALNLLGIPFDHV